MADGRPREQTRGAMFFRVWTGGGGRTTSHSRAVPRTRRRCPYFALREASWRWDGRRRACDIGLQPQDDPPLRLAMPGSAMSASIVRSRTLITGVTDRFTWNQIDDGAILQEDGVIAADRQLRPTFRPSHPTVPVIGSGQGDRAARLRQRPSPCRPDAGAARLARHAAGALVHHPHGDPQPRPLSRHALLGLRDDRLGHHDGAAHPGPGCRARAVGRRSQARHRDHPRLRGCRHAGVSYCYAVRDQNRLVYQADEEFVEKPAGGAAAAPCSAGSTASR